MSKFNFLGFTPLPIESAAGLIEQLTRKVRQRRGEGITTRTSTQWALISLMRRSKPWGKEEDQDSDVISPPDPG